MEPTSGGKSDASLWANKFDPVTNDSIGSIFEPSLWPLQLEIYSYTETEGLDPHSKKTRASESRSRISTGANLSPKGCSEIKNQATLKFINLKFHQTSRVPYPSPTCPWPRLGGRRSDICIVRNVPDRETIGIANYLRMI